MHLFVVELIRMPSAEDLNQFKLYLDSITTTYDLLLDRDLTPMISKHERELLQTALLEFSEQNVERLRTAYAELTDDEAQDLGLTKAQLRAKAEFVAEASERIGRQLEASGKTVRPTTKIRHWLKRAKGPAESLASCLPAGHALLEILDLLNFALDK
jgi:uncharacterized protein YjiS (DUF1127 family)